jgi:hypothetical protein
MRAVPVSWNSTGEFVVPSETAQSCLSNRSLAFAQDDSSDGRLCAARLGIQAVRRATAQIEIGDESLLTEYFKHGMRRLQSE